MTRPLIYPWEKNASDFADLVILVDTGMTYILVKQLDVLKIWNSTKVNLLAYSKNKKQEHRFHKCPI